MTFDPSRIYFDRQGRALPMLEWARLFEDVDYKRVARTVVTVGEITSVVSTVWLGLDHRFAGDGPPLIFETMVFDGPMDEAQQRYGSEAAALAGHDQMVAAVREALRMLTDR